MTELEQAQARVVELETQVAWLGEVIADQDKERETARNSDAAVALAFNYWIGVVARRTARGLWALLTPRQKARAERELILPWWLTETGDAWKERP